MTDSVKDKLMSDAFGRGKKHKKKKSQLFELADSEVKTDVKSIPESEQLYKDRYSTPERLSSIDEFKANTELTREVKKAKNQALKADRFGDTKSLESARKKLASYAKKADKLGMVDAFKKGLKGIPLLGGLATAAMSGDASAALPVDAEALGPAKGSPEAIIQDPNASEEERRSARERLLQLYK